MAHCSKCCDGPRNKGIVQFLAAVVITGLSYWAVSYLAPGDWTFGQKMAAAGVIILLGRN